MSTPAPTVNKWLVAASVTFGTLMGAIDSSIINVALPNIQASLGVTITEVTWVSTAYLISLVLIMPLTAWLGTVLGRKNVYQACLVIFTAASVLAGFSTNLQTLLIARLLQGLGAGALQPTEQAILRETFPLEEQGMAMGLYGLAVMIGPAVGPTFGGWLTDNYGWRSIFFINLPIGIVGYLMVKQFVSEPAYIRQKASSIDIVGIALMCVGLSTLLVVLEEGDQWDWFTSPLVWSLAIVAAVTLVGFILWELYGTDRPAVDLRILKNPSFSSGTTLGGALGIVLFGGLFLLPLFFQELLGYTAMQSGLALMPRSLVMLVMMPFTGMLYNSLGPRVLIGSGFIVTAGSLYAMSRFTVYSDAHQILIPQMVSGVGFALIFVALSTTTMARVERAKLSAAAGLYNLVRQLGGSFGTAAFATLLERDITRQHALLSTHASVDSPAFSTWLGGINHAMLSQSGDPVAASHRAMALADGLLVQQATNLAFDHLFALVALLVLVPMPLLFWLRPAVLKEKTVAVE